MMRKVFTYLLMSVCMTACVDDFEPNEIPDSRNIQLSATIGNPIISSRTADDVKEAEVWRGTTPSALQPLAVKLLMSLESGLYDATPTSTNFLPCHTSIEYTDNLPKDPDDVIYTAGNNSISGKPKYPTALDANGNPSPVFCSGLYPNDGWTISKTGNQSIARIPIDGTQDVMYAPEITGDVDNPLPPQTFQHMLSWIKVNVCCTKQAAAEIWGDVEWVKIQSCSTLAINLSTEQATGEGTADLLIHNTVTPLETAVTAVGSVLCVPATSYTIKIKVSNVAEPQTITINPPSGVSEFLPGKLYILEIYFDTDSTESICTLTEWDYQDEDLKLN